MVQVDIFWAYGLNAGLALAANKKLAKEKSFWNNPYFTLSLLWTAIFFAPSGIYLLWNFPYWETMFVARDHDSIPAWLTCIFSITNITQGVLGFWVTWYFIKQGNQKLAALQTIWSHAAMLFILIVGWDGTGYKPFFYPGTGNDWQSGVSYPITAFFTCPVFSTLLGMGVILVPTYFWLVARFRRDEEFPGMESKYTVATPSSAKQSL
jgi:hypothetical protein